MSNLGNGQMNFIGNGKSISMNVPTIEDEKIKAAAADYNKAVTEEQAKQRRIALERELEQAKKVEENAQNMEMAPLNGNILIRPYDKNPFSVLKMTDAGLILPPSSSTFESPDSGETEDKLSAVKYADVIEVSPGVEDIVIGDVILYREYSALPVPFFQEGYWVTHRNNILVVVNTNLTERLGLNKNA